MYISGKHREPYRDTYHLWQSLSSFDGLSNLVLYVQTSLFFTERKER